MVISAARAAAIVQRNHFFCLYQKNKFSESKVKLRLASNPCKVILKAAKLAYANKRKDSISSLKLGSQSFGVLLIVFSKKEMLFFASDEIVLQLIKLFYEL